MMGKSSTLEKLIGNLGQAEVPLSHVTTAA